MSSLFYRITAFGKPLGPWRASEKRAESDAAGLELGSYDEWGKFFVDAGAEIESAHEYELMRRGEAHRAGYTRTPAQGLSPVRRQA